MGLEIKSEPVPLGMGVDGVIRVGGTRVTLDTIVAAFREGATAEEIAQQYSSLALDDVYAVITYVLRHGPEVDDYLNERNAFAGAVRRGNEARNDPRGIRCRLMARRGGVG